jgi:hypothetical protein
VRGSGAQGRLGEASEDHALLEVNEGEGGVGTGKEERRVIVNRGEIITSLETKARERESGREP